MKASNMKPKGQRPHTNKQIDGKGKSDDPYFNYGMTILVGCSAEVTTRDGEVYEGIYVAFSQAMEILLEAAHLVTSDSKEDTSIEKHFDVLVIPSEKVLSMKCVNADLTYPTREFATDTAISSSRGGSMRDKELTPWDGSDETPEDLGSLEAGSGNANGWEAKDMFKKNEEKYGVVSSFNHDLSGYTTQVDKNDTEFKRLEEQANQIATEIEKGTASWERTQAENGDEEEAFSAVVRPQRNNATNSTVNNNYNNNTSSVARNDKYIPPSRRQPNMQSAPPPTQPHTQPHPQPPPPTNNNGPSHNTNNNSSGIARKPMYNQNQNPRNTYGPPPNVVYHQDRRNFDSRRAPPPNQYGNSAGHGDVRRPPPEDSGPRPQRINKVPLDRKDPTKLKEFGNNFRLQQGPEPPQLRRPPPQQVGVPPHNLATNSASAARNPSPPSATVSISSNKNKKEESPGPLPPLIPPSNAAAEPNPAIPESSPLATSNSAANSTTSSAVPSSATPNTPNVANVSASESTITSTSSMTSPASSDNQTPSSTSDSKSAEAENKKQFKFNPNAKEFNPSKFASRSPSTPPRPPSTPATAAPPPVMAASAIHPYMPISMPPALLYAPAAQPYAQAALTPSSNSSTSSCVTTPRHGGHNRKGGMVGIPQRNEMTPPIQMTTGPPILAPATAIQAGPPHTQYFVSQPPYPVMRVGVVPQGVMPVFPTAEGSGGAQLHPPMHYLAPNGGNHQNNAGHQPHNAQVTNPTAPTSVVRSNGHGYSQTGGSHSGSHSHHMGYPIVGLPVAYGFPNAPNVIQLPYVPHQHMGQDRGD